LGGWLKPLDLLSSNVNKEILVRIKDGREFRGKLREVDSYMNMILSSVEEIEGEERKKRETVLLRGNNVVYISLGPWDE